MPCLIHYDVHLIFHLLLFSLILTNLLLPKHLIVLEHLETPSKNINEA